MSQNRVSAVLTKQGIVGVSATDNSHKVFVPEWGKMFRELVPGGKTQQDVADIFGVNRRTVGDKKWMQERIAETMGVNRAIVSQRVRCHDEIRPLFDDVSRLTLPEFHYFEVLPLVGDGYFSGWLVAVALDSGLSGPEKGDAIIRLRTKYGKRWKSVQSVADDLGVQHKTILNWMYKARRLSLVVRGHLSAEMLGEFEALALAKYDKGTQEALAGVIIGSGDVGGLSRGWEVGSRC